MNPFVKWAGGKCQLADRIKELMPEQHNRYYEPFVGGGAILFALQPKTSCINDINRSLITAYQAIRDTPAELIARIGVLDKIPCTRIAYGVFRDTYNQLVAEERYDINLAALFIYLNKHCFNGLYRVNSKGEFNSPGITKPAGSPFPRKTSWRCPSFCKG